MMCERSSCHVLNAATNYIYTETLTAAAAKATTNAYKCQAGFYINRKRQQEQQQQQLKWQQNVHECNQQEQQKQHSCYKQSHHSSSNYHHSINNNKNLNVKMLQHEQRQQIQNDKNMLYDLAFPINYKPTTSNNTHNLIKTKSLSNNTTTKNTYRTTILDSSNPQQQQQPHHHPHHQQQMQPSHHQQQYTNYTHDTTMSSINAISTSSSSSTPSPPSPPPPSNSIPAGGASCYGSPGCTGGGAAAAPTTIGVNLRVTGQCSQGGRKYMEDYFSVAYQQSENAKDLEYAFIGIYDGHGGAEAATFAKEHLMMQIINQKAFWSDSDHDVLRAIREGYIATHYAMWRDQENWPKTANGLLSTAGTTATVAFIRREKIYIGHVGDSGIVLGYQNEGEKFWRAQQLTVDHKPESAEERARIQRSGGKVVVKSGVPRVVWNRPRNAGHRGPIRCNTPVDEVPFLAVARSLGDLWSYNSMRNIFVVSPDPDVQVIKINPRTFKCLIFGTDGLWNVVTPQEAVDTVYERECINERLQAYANAEGANMEWTNPSKGLVERALKTWSAKKMRADNTSVVTVILYPPGSEAVAPANSNQPTHLPYNNCLSNGSCGYEYTEMCAEMQTANHCYGISYEEIAEKHQRPEAFRDFDYYLDEELVNASLQAQQQQHEDNCVGENKRYCNGDLTYWNNWSWDERHTECAAGDYNHHTSTSSDVSICSKAISHDDGGGGVVNNCASIIPNVGDENAVDGAPTSLNYAHYHTSGGSSGGANNNTSNSNASSDVSNELGGGGNASFMTFAESYNSFLNEQMSHDSTNSSNSNSNCQIISGTSEILQEQQLYQQQCMSEEEGYSLTKLETRREQQRCSGGVQTFKIFQAHDTSGASYVPQRTHNDNQHKHNASAQQAQRPNESIQSHTPPAPHLTLQETRELEEALTWEPGCAPLGTMNHFIDYAAEHQQPLELSSLLQQEREEEQQVAYERRLQMQRQLAQASATTTNAVIEVTKLEHKNNAEREDVEPQQTVLQTTTLDENVEEVLVEDYIEEEEVESAAQEQAKGTNAAQTDKDKSVQINEVSSSNDEQNECENSKGVSLTTATSAQVIEKIEKIEILQPKVDAPKLERLGRHPLMLHKSPPLSHYRKSKGSSTLSCATSGTISTTTTNRDKPKVATFEFSSRPPKACPGRTSLKRSQTQFPNIPNENARFCETQSSHEMSKRRRYDGYSECVLGAVSSTSSNNHHHHHHNNNSHAANASANNGGSSSSRNTTNNNYRNRRCNSATAMAHAGSSSSGSCAASVFEKRQLRSNSGTIDYSKRTLRTRNSLAKDLKAKASLTTTMRRVTTQFLHDRAVSLMQSSSELAQQREQHNIDANRNSSRISINRNNSAHSSNTCNSASGSGIVSRRARAEKLLAAANADKLEAAFSHVINLRSRKVAHLAVAAAAAAAAANHTHPATRRTKGSLSGGGGGSPLVSSSTTLMRRERHNLRSLSTRNAASASLMCSASSQRGEYGNYGKSTRSGTGICAYSLSSTSASATNNKLLSRATGLTVTSRPRAHALLMTKQAVGSGDGSCAAGVNVTTNGVIMRGGSSITVPLTQPPTSYGKRTTALRSGSGGSVGGAATTMMLTRSGRNVKRLSR